MKEKQKKNWKGEVLMIVWLAGLIVCEITKPLVETEGVFLFVLIMETVISYALLIPTIFSAIDRKKINMLLEKDVSQLADNPEKKAMYYEELIDAAMSEPKVNWVKTIFGLVIIFAVLAVREYKGDYEKYANLFIYVLGAVSASYCIFLRQKNLEVYNKMNSIRKQK